MMKEEKILKEKFGTANHFAVPDGYFDSFADQLMEQLPESREHQVIEMRAQTWWNRLPLRKVAAAVGVAIVLGSSSLYVVHQQASSKVSAIARETSSHPSSSTTEYGSFDEMADYTMMDNQDIYASLVAENETSIN